MHARGVLVAGVLVLWAAWVWRGGGGGGVAALHVEKKVIEHHYLKADRIHLVDVPKKEGLHNWLFRGNLPKNHSDAFDYNHLVAYLRKAAKKEHIKLPTDFFVIDVSFLDKSKSEEVPDLQLEADYWAAHPSRGRLEHWPLVGDFNRPSEHTLGLAERAVDVGEWQTDALVDKVRLVHEWLNTDFGRPTLIYVHCEAGIDRTGEFCGSYELTYKGTTYAKYLKYQRRITRNMQPHMHNAFHWYCYYLRFTSHPQLTCK